MKYEYLFCGLSSLEVEHKLRQIIDCAVASKYGECPDELILKRIEEEWAAMDRTGVICDVAALYELADWLKKYRHPYWVRGCSGSSFILYLLGITTGNPLPPHYYCSTCKTVQWQPAYTDGFDLPQDMRCTKDNVPFFSDGHDISWQVLFGFGDLSPVFDVDLPSDLYEDFRSQWDNHWLKDIDQKNMPNNPYEDKRQCIKLSQLSLMFHLEREKISSAFYDHNYTSRDRDFFLLEWNLSIDHDMELSNTIPEPDRVADLISLYGLSHSTGVWDETAIYMVDEMGYFPSDMIVYRDDVYNYLMGHGFLGKDAWRGMNDVCKGKWLPVVTTEMRKARDKWVLSRCKKIEYLFPKAHAIEDMFFTMRSVF